MIAVTKSMLTLSVLMSVGLVAALDSIGSRAEEQSAATQITQRFPLTSEMFSPVSIAYFTAQKFAEQKAKADRLPLPDSCARQEWPYLSQQCLIASDGSPARKVNRFITVERRLGDNVSELVRLPVADLAQR
jgi:hypothetical protein